MICNFAKYSAFIAASAILVACGGGGADVGGGVIGSGGSTDIPVIGSGNTPDNLVISGTAATGLAIADAPISAKCQTGIGTATSNSEGTYQLTVPIGKLPCILQVTNPVDSAKYHSLATGVGRTSLSNITPLTELVAARLLGSDPKTVFANFNGSAVHSLITDLSLQNAVADVRVVLGGIVNTGALGNFVTTPLKAATATNPNGGDAQDKLLDGIKQTIGRDNLTRLVTQLASSAKTSEIKVTVDVTIETATGPKTLNVPLLPASSIINGWPDTLPTAIQNDGALSFWPMVTDASSYSYGWDRVYAPLRADSFPPGIWPVHFKYSQLSRLDLYGFRSNVNTSWGCSLNLVGSSLVATVGGRTFTMPLDGVPEARFAPDGSPIAGDVFASGASQRTIGAVSTVRSLDVYAEAENILIHPQYGPVNGGPTLHFWVTYDPNAFYAAMFETVLQISIQEMNTDPLTKIGLPIVSTSYRCTDTNSFPAPNSGNLPADSVEF
ncbi:MAG: hypothetical protein KJ614_17855 [Gammaproteobacteria bacterium]|uniref:hypothetical protein n=1 Tax=Rhodoferax sp. TaxID=50421 RepID=UPI0017D67F80|nr:hypothetical protein [Rhodoferax sp.]MBU3900753.1 hypothetical protein [Gammaproteobacteria bacterium]MBA3056702.1 hypothetical protein [Rhodoferax sp.]MBU4079504.1 hypothetical protein [Gammaproteobacteria bacterium]MBU4114788.1 hypothetical protein [Gammaproteobacteria bacterium]MBU4170541.1 hypothetical protein [Gammaproteobacteria bacterium]